MGLTEELNVCDRHQLFETWALLVGHDILAESRLMNKAQIFSYMATYMMQQLGKLESPELFLYELSSAGYNSYNSKTVIKNHFPQAHLLGF